MTLYLTELANLFIDKLSLTYKYYFNVNHPCNISVTYPLRIWFNQYNISCTLMTSNISVTSNYF